MVTPTLASASAASSEFSTGWRLSSSFIFCKKTITSAKQMWIATWMSEKTSSFCAETKW